MRVLAATIIVTGVMGIVGALVVSGGGDSTVRAGPGVEGPTEEEPSLDDHRRDPAADVLEIGCGRQGQGLELNAGRVMASAEGVPVLVVALPDDGTSVELVRTENRGAGMRPVFEGAYEVGEAVFDRVGPGQARVRCYPDEGPRHMMSAEEDPESVGVEIVDHGGFWQDPGALECESELRQSTVVDYVAPSGPSVESDREPSTADLENLARRDLPVGPGDRIEIAGYDSGNDRVVEVVRDGRVIIQAQFRVSRGQWTLGGYDACAEIESTAPS